MKPRPFLLVLLVLLAGTCGDDGTRPPAAPIPLPQMAAELKSALCARIYSCCSPELRKNNARIGQDVASCQAALDFRATYLLDDVHLSVEGGRLVYDPAQLTSCLARIQSASCEDLRAPASNADVTRTACGAVLAPRVPIGGACSDTWDCIDGWCQGDEGNLRDHCAPLRPDGEDCDEGLECRSGICNDDRICAPAPTGRGSICALGTEIVGQHGAAP